jgi:hypothetical protein
MSVLTKELIHDQIRSGGVNIVAIHGINGTYEKTWTHKKTRKLWRAIYFLLSPEIPVNTQIFLYRYNSRLYVSHSKADREDYVRLLVFV